MNPKVSFIVPCYKLAHYLSDCVNSILAQTYTDFEVLIMDDVSPDNTPEVAAKFEDPRVIYIRNEKNLGNIRNYNKGIGLSRGRYIWLISADDCLRSEHVLQKYVDLLEQNPQVGYVFCPAVTLRDGAESGVWEWTAWPGDQDRILSGREVLKHSAAGCPVCSPTGLVRKECYTHIDVFPESLPRAGDWYLWAAFATAWDAGYFAEPMVYYRQHATNMEKTLEKDDPSFFFNQDFIALWSIKKVVDKSDKRDMSSEFIRALVNEYLKRLVEKEVNGWQHGPTWETAEQDIRSQASDNNQAEEMLRRLRNEWPRALSATLSFIGAVHYNQGKLDLAVTAFRSSLASYPWSIRPRFYLAALKLERLSGIQLVSWLGMFKKGLFRFIRPLTSRL